VDDRRPLGAVRPIGLLAVVDGLHMPRAPGTRNNRLRSKRGRRHDQRAPSSQRGYDREWSQLRNAYAQQYPLCEHCLKRSVITPMHEVDHIVPFSGLADPLRLAWDNLQSLCRPCHATKTAQQGGGQKL
jgi:5-methylcytosine-specific restriction endonuclease McrA